MALVGASLIDVNESGSTLLSVLDNERIFTLCLASQHHHNHHNHHNHHIYVSDLNLVCAVNIFALCLYFEATT